MKKKQFQKKEIIILFSIIIISFFTISSISAAATDSSCELNLTILNQDPYPAIPNEYVDVVFQLRGLSNSNCKGARIELVPNYPFSLDENNSLREIKGSTYIPNYKNEWMIPYKVRIDKDALDGENILEIRYAPGIWGEDSYLTKKFNINIQDSRTTFDAVIQEMSGSDISIAIANTGKYTANSVVIRIPEQSAYRAQGTSGQMVGNLDSGDYTIVSFSITKSRSNENNNLLFDIYYTDILGIRRTVNIEMSLDTGGLIGGNYSREDMMNNRNFQRNRDSGWSIWYTIIIIVIILITIIIFYKKYKKSSHKKNSHNSGSTPSWIKNIVEKEKK
ncbi:hypothetical protein GOV12_04355 [Candidatus Pacearchaeota archaeon]|nr:hypothetical protein [Candidatus Pacearchaeota archaeon]